MKKASLPINMTFLIVIGLIASFLIIGMLVNWSFDAGRLMDNFNKEESSIPDNQKIDVSLEDCTLEIIKYSKLCYAKVTQEKTKAGLCYVLYKCNSYDGPKVFDDLNLTFKTLTEQDKTAITSYTPTDSKVIIKYSGGIKLG